MPSASTTDVKRTPSRAPSRSRPPRSTSVTSPRAFAPAGIAIRSPTRTSRVTRAITSSSTRARSLEIDVSTWRPTTEYADTISSSNSGTAGSAARIGSGTGGRTGSSAGGVTFCVSRLTAGNGSLSNSGADSGATLATRARRSRDAAGRSGWVRRSVTGDAGVRPPACSVSSATFAADCSTLGASGSGLTAVASVPAAAGAASLPRVAR